MSDVQKLDDASWHFGGDFPGDQPAEHGGIHMAMFLRWCFAKGWGPDVESVEERLAIAQVISGELSGTEYLFKYLDGKLFTSNLNETGSAFPSQYYGEHGHYLDDFSRFVSDQWYIVPEGSLDFDKFSEMVEARYQSGNLTKPPESASQRKPWWKFW